MPNIQNSTKIQRCKIIISLVVITLFIFHLANQIEYLDQDYEDLYSNRVIKSIEQSNYISENIDGEVFDGTVKFNNRKRNFTSQKLQVYFLGFNDGYYCKFPDREDCMIHHYWFGVLSIFCIIYFL